MIKIVFIVGNPVRVQQEQLTLDLIPRALHHIACSQLEKTGDANCAECIHELAAASSDSWEKTAHGLKCSVQNATFELLYDAPFVDIRGVLRAALKQPVSRRIIAYVGAVGQNASGASPTGGQWQPIKGVNCASAWLLRDTQVGPGDLAPLVAECEDYLSNLLRLIKLDRRNAAVLANGDSDKVEFEDLGTLELLVPFADSDWLLFEKRPCSHTSYSVHVHALEHADASADDAVADSVAQLAARLAQAIVFEPAALVASDVVGNIRFARPTLYVFASGDGDAALLGVPGFAMLLDGGYSAQPAYWQLVRHLDRIDAVLVSHAALDNLFGLSNILRHKAAADSSAPSSPVLAHALLNTCTFGPGTQHPEPLTTPTLSSLKVQSVSEADELVRLLAANHIPVSPLLRATGQPPTRINLFHKIGQGSFDLYVLNPIDSAKELVDVNSFVDKLLRDLDAYAARLSNPSDTAADITGKSSSPTDRRQPSAKAGSNSYPLSDLVSVCALLVYHPASSSEPVTRLLLTGACPQLKVLEGLERMRTVDFLKVPQYHDLPTRTLSFGKLPSAAAGFSLAPSNSHGSVTTPTRKSALQLSTSRPSTTSDNSRFKAPALPPRGSTKINVPAPTSTTKRAPVNGEAKLPAARNPTSVSKKVLNSTPAINGDRERPQTAPAVTKAPATTTRRKPEPPAVNGSSTAKKPLKASSTRLSPPAKRAVKDNSAALTVTSGDDKQQNHVVVVATNGDSASQHSAEQVVPEHSADAIESDTTNGLTNGHHNDATPEPEEHLEVAVHEEHTNGIENHEDNSGPVEVEVEVEMSAEEFARALAAASAHEDGEDTSNWGVSLGLPLMTDGDENGVAPESNATDAASTAQPETSTQVRLEDSENAPATVAPAAEPAAATPSKTTARAASASRTSANAKQAPKTATPTKTTKTAASNVPKSDSKKTTTTTSRPPSSSRTTTSSKSASAKSATASPTKERAGTSRTSGTTSGVPFYVDLAYIPAHGNPKYVDAEFFRRVRARYYVLSCLQPSAKVLDALLDAKASCWEHHGQTTLIPTYDSEQLTEWMTANTERLAQLQVDVAPPANRCTVQLQDHTDQCSAYRLEF